MKHQPYALLTLIALVVGLTACGISNLEEENPDSVVSSSTVIPLTTSVGSDAVTTVLPQAHTATPVATLTPHPTPASCETGFMTVTTGRLGESLSIMCADGSYKWPIPIQLGSSIESIDVSPTGHQLALATYDTAKVESTVYVVDLEDYNLREIGTVRWRVRGLSWSHDSEYLAYGVEDMPYLYTLHVASRTVSQITGSAVQSTGDKYLPSPVFPEWSPTDAQLLYVAYTNPSASEMLPPNGYMATVTCSPDNHTCAISSRKTVPVRDGPMEFSIKNGDYLFWVDNAQAFVRMSIDFSENFCLLEYANLDGIPYKETILHGDLLGVKFDPRIDFAFTSDGKYLAFYDPLNSALAVLDLDNMSVSHLPFGGILLDWIPYR